VRPAGISSAAGVVFAFLASQHHNLHMLLGSLGLGGAGLSLTQNFPGIRRAMLLVSLTMVAAGLFTLRRRAGATHRVFVLTSTALTIGLVAWSVVRFGF
jgi:hypothetical protein